MNGEVYFIFRVSRSRRKSGVYILKLPQRGNEWSSIWEKDTKGENNLKIASSVKDAILNINL